MRILIIEDQEYFVELLKKGLEKEGFAVDVVTDGELGGRRLAMYHKDYDAVILDLNLPGKSGSEICKQARSFGVATPILILTAKDDVLDKVSLLDMGADDYLFKPFEFEELLARLRALTRRPMAVLPTELIVQNIRLNPATKQVYKDGENVKVSLTEFRLLEYLLRNTDRIIEREDIYNNVWDFNDNSFSNVVDVYINHLREKLEKGGAKKFIETIRGVGYRVKTN